LEQYDWLLIAKAFVFLAASNKLEKTQYPAQLSRMIYGDGVPNAMNSQGMFKSFTVLILSSSALHKFDPRYPNIVFLK
jgi:hypothetical protein